MVTSNDASSTTIIDGFFITAGLDTGVTAGMGGGMDNSGGSPTLANLTFSGNSSYSNGGGMGTVTAVPH